MPYELDIKTSLNNVRKQSLKIPSTTGLKFENAAQVAGKLGGGFELSTSKIVADRKRFYRGPF